MKWTQITVTTSHESSEAVSNLFFELGAKGVQISEAVLPPPAEKPDVPSDLVLHITASFPTDDLVGERAFKLRQLLNDLRIFNLKTEPAQIKLESFETENWAEKWKSAFPPQIIGKRLLVSPTWHQIEKSPEQVLISLDPGMAFGTGYHPTTQLSLCLLEEVLGSEEKVADIGTGSGILAIAAALLGAGKITAVDIDEHVIPIAQKNAIQNGVQEQIEFLRGDAFESIDGVYDVIIVNILTKVILPIIPNCSEYLTPNGLCIFSGILKKEVTQIEETLNEHSFKIVKVLAEEKWVGLLVEKCSAFGEDIEAFSRTTPRE